MIRRISPGAVPPSLPSAPGASHHHADAPQAGVQPPADSAHHAPRLRPAPPRKRRRGMRSLDGMDDERDATELEEAEAARVSALRGRVSIAVAQPQGQGQRQDDQHGEGGNAQAGDPQAGRGQSASPVQLDDNVRARVDGVLDRYATTRAADPTVRRRALAVALVELRAIGIAHPAAAQLTTMVWRLMREHLRSGTASTAAENLQALRKLLVELVAAQPEPSPALRNFHLLLPLVLLNAEKPRKRLDRAGAITRLNTLLIEHQERTAQEIRA
ncbi:4-hydroxyphenylacetate catabolism regulator HpaA [Xanthomonas hortorum]|uniref:4-hydroxyphenylacetate catabolism regulator HpaA n=1 Tax=Xanthomonas hortorum pv. pelargonii TaxID=453602 RepID=A0A6V7BVD9_9XANT|nr:4-hydroxyphenylacetate catabolism regulator HpaA [Xanthomonas hortorum]MCE4353829.1 4-hydroxyphenylacetate catabolism regulator HpaA [Xanthomonas hortorum pv. pelargonii]MCM5522729.1 4-hydroxyphenylacetate catabolism regulator HpaA [Xanthomonas hortorum pv. pelargonii]MCM5535308.1 4-hydroxyphenylacetate catabolism regulator HpaA [Xanthomonas hortorum pv. pelargonii]MCM5538837.1 4-hydroxyphenylacetate catabolism regulator HpaA [Xanthomonas hortorum pv. pelargonii]MCM5543191.1 4-hydroxyphenyl